MKKELYKSILSLLFVMMIGGVLTTFAQVPTITSFSPTSAKPGDAVTLTGTNFNTTPANNIVFFGATRATVTAATATSVTVTVPSGATYAPITLLNTATSLAASSVRNFTPTYSPAKTSITTSDFQAMQDFSTGGGPQFVVMGDLDGDGKSDLVVANSNSATVSVYRNTSSSGSIGSGSFAPKVDFATGSRPYSVAIGDLDGDGRLDLAVANYISNTVSVIRNTSSSGSIDIGSFAAKVDFSTGANPYSVTIGDLDGDGKPELAVTNYIPNTVSVFRNTSSSGSIVAGSFAAKVDFTTGTRPISVAIGDLDGDSKPDLAVANNVSNTVSVYRNTSSIGSIDIGSFASKVDVTTGSGPFSVAIGDLDGDGKSDLAVANLGSNTVSVIRNTSSSGSIGTGSFAAKVDFTTGTNPSSVAIGDLDGDSKPDLAVANFGPGKVSVIRNTATSGSIVSGSFAAKVDFNTGFYPYSVAIGDLDGDGKSDLAVASSSLNTVSVLRNTSNTELASLTLSSGTLTPIFAPVTTTYTASVNYATTSLRVTPTRADANATITVNGITTVSGSASSAIALSVGSNTITIQVTAQDDGTQKTYTVIVTRAEIPPIITNFSPLNAKPGEVVTLTGTGFNTTPTNNVVFFGATRATVTAASANSVTVTVPSGATYAPITLLNTATKLAAYSLRNFTPTYSPAKTTITTSDFQAKQDFSTGLNPYSVAMGDLDGDGKPDMAVANYSSNTVSVYRNTSSSGSIGSGSFAAKVDFTTGSSPISVAIGDLDGDGKPDLAVANYGSDAVSVFRNTAINGSIDIGSFAAKVDFTTASGSYSTPFSVAMGDLDGDGKLELAVANVNSNTVSVFRNTSTSGNIDIGSFAAKVDFITGSNPRSVAMGDLDGDGKPDLVVANNVSNTVSVYRNTSSIGSIDIGSFAAKVDFATADGPISVALGDLDGDGKSELAVANLFSNTVSVFRNTSNSGSIGTGSFAVKVDFIPGSRPYSVALGDLNGDGKPDLAVANFGSNTVSVIRNTSSSGSIAAGSFATKVDFTTGSFPRSVALGDLDGDGKPELSVANETSNSVSVLRNTSNNADLAGLTLSSGTLTPIFAPVTTIYTASVNNATTSLTVTPTRADANATITVNGVTTVSGSASGAIALSVGSNSITTQVTSQDGTQKSYTITVTRAASNNADLSGLTLSSGTLTPIFTAATTIYTASVNYATTSLTVTPTRADATATIRVNGVTTVSGSASGAIALSVGSNNTITIQVTAQDGTQKPYTVTVTRAEAPPIITNFSPLNAKPGDAVTLTGTNFNTTPNNNVVFFGATRATVTAASANSVTVTVPSGATYAPITLLNTATKLAAYSLVNFTPTYSPAKTVLTATDFQPKQDFTTGTTPFSVAMGDLDGDGKPDMAVANYNSNTISVYRNTSSSGSIVPGSFAAKVDFPTGTSPQSVALGDLDGDGKPDLVVANYSSDAVSVFRNTAISGSIDIGSFAAKVDFTTGSFPYSVAIGDLDGDGKLDLAVTNDDAATVSVIRNTSTSGSIVPSSFAANVDFATGDAPISVAIGDLDGDGKPDLAVANNGNTVSVIRNTSSSGSIVASSFAPKVDFAAGFNPQSIAMGDLDGDGKPDLAVANSSSNTVSVYRNTSSSGSIVAGSFADKVDFIMGSRPYSVALGDLDGDGKPDLAVTNFGSKTISVLRNTSSSGSIVTGSFAAKVDYTTSANPFSAAIGDLDGDGRPELAVANSSSNTVSVLRNADNILISIKNGSWNDPTTWNVNRVPLPSDLVIIDQNHTVDITTTVSAKAIEFRNNAKVSFSNVSAKLNIGL